MEKSKTVKESYTEQCQIVFSEHINGNGRLFGGRLVEWMDVVAGVVARRHSEYEVTTVSIDKVDFTAPANINDLVIIIGKLIYVGNTSMAVKISTFVEKRNGERIQINSAVFILVALDENDKPTRVPRLTLVTEEEKKESQEFENKKRNS